MAVMLNTKTKKLHHVAEGGRAHKHEEKTNLLSAAILNVAWTKQWVTLRRSQQITKTQNNSNLSVGYNRKNIKETFFIQKSHTKE